MKLLAILPLGLLSGQGWLASTSGKFVFLRVSQQVLASITKLSYINGLIQENRSQPEVTLESILKLHLTFYKQLPVDFCLTSV